MLNNLRLIIQPTLLLWLLSPWLDMFPNISLRLGFHDLIHGINQPLKVEKITSEISCQPEPPARNRVEIVTMSVKLTPSNNSLIPLNIQSKRLKGC